MEKQIKRLVKKFFDDEEGMETLQVVLIVCVACAIIMSVYNAFKNGWWAKIKAKVEEILGQNAS